MRPLRSLSYVPALDGLRGIAILLVMGTHFRVPGFDGGSIGVDLFFVLSGFLITSLLLAEHATTGRISLSRFYWRRGLRLLPALAVVVTVVLAADTLIRPFGLSMAQHGEVVGTILYAANWFTILHWSSPSSLMQMWSLSVEEHFYLLWPLLLMGMLGRGWSPRTILSVTLLLTAASTVERLMLWRAGASATRLYYGTDIRAEGLLLGCAAAMLWATAPVHISQRWRRVSALAGWAIILITTAASYGNAERWQYGAWVSLVALASAVVIVEAVHPSLPWATHLLTAPPLVGLGQISYGVYLWHIPVRSALLLAFGLPLADWTPWLALLAAPVSIGLAVLSYRSVEIPLRRLGTRQQRAAPAVELAPVS